MEDDETGKKLIAAHPRLSAHGCCHALTNNCRERENGERRQNGLGERSNKDRCKKRKDRTVITVHIGLKLAA